MALIIILPLASEAGPVKAARTYNSQTIPLLQPDFGLKTPLSKGGGSIDIVDSALVPQSGPLGTAADLSAEFPGGISFYVVREGDTVGKIAEMFELKETTIRWANDIGQSGLIKPEQMLEILPVDGVKYTVKKGDTLKGIIEKLKVGEEEAAQLRVFNDDLDPENLAAGEEIIVPGGKLAESSYVTPKKISAGSRKKIRGSGPEYPGFYIRPVLGGLKSQDLHGYNAIDIAVNSGTPVVAAAAGTISVSKPSGYNGGYGKYVMIDHLNGTATLYSHLSQVVVQKGADIVQGQVIGYSGSTGRSTGPHLHFEVRGAKNPGADNSWAR